MSLFPRSGRILALALLATLVTFRSASGQGKDKGDDVHFDTADGVKLEGTFWAAKDGKKAPVALLLHDFTSKGGTSHDDGWDSLAAALNKQGYAVLQFDFRGYGKSTTISNPTFWNQPHNRAGIRGLNPLKPPEALDKATFLPHYYPNLVNDVVAARAFLDRKNDSGELNTSNLVVIGAGHGATLGSLWLASECHRKRGMPQVMSVPPTTDPRLIKWDMNYECKDVRAAIWLSISPSLISSNGLPVRDWFLEAAGKMHKVPTVFLFGKEDKAGDERALNYMRALVPDYARGKPVKDYPLSGEKGIDKASDKLTGSKLLQKALDTENWIVNAYLADEDMKKSLKEEWRDRDSAKSKQYWLFPGATPALPMVVPAKNEGDLLMLPLLRFRAQ
jgi:pimeloyl-ACP methyl ester carboxylesterase